MNERESIYPPDIACIILRRKDETESDSLAGRYLASSVKYLPSKMETRSRSAASGAPNNVDNLASPPGLYTASSMTDERLTKHAKSY